MLIGQKHALMTYILTFLAHSAVYTNNLFEASLTIGNELKRFEALKSMEGLEPIIKRLQTVEPLGLNLAYDDLQERLLKLQEQKSLFFLVGDFFEEIDLSLLAQKHELCVIMLRDRWEENPSLSSDVALVNPLSNATIAKGFSKKALMEYGEKLKIHDEKLYKHFGQHRIKHVKIYEPSEVFQKLEQLFYF